MIANRKICVVLPAYNAGRTLQATFRARGAALSGGMPVYKYIANRALTLAQNLLVGHKLPEYHTGYRGLTRSVFEALPLERNSDDFTFDNQMLTQAIYKGFRVGEVSCPTSYVPEAPSISFRRSVIYALRVLRTSVSFRLACLGFDRGTIFEGTAADTSLMAPA
jgi:hypothetical protein